jgi:hypothetical protein
MSREKWIGKIDFAAKCGAASKRPDGICAARSAFDFCVARRVAPIVARRGTPKNGRRKRREYQRFKLGCSRLWGWRAARDAAIPTDPLTGHLSI